MAFIWSGIQAGASVLPYIGVGAGTVAIFAAKDGVLRVGFQEPTDMATQLETTYKCFGSLPPAQRELIEKARYETNMTLEELETQYWDFHRQVTKRQGELATATRWEKVKQTWTRDAADRNLKEALEQFHQDVVATTTSPRRREEDAEREEEEARAIAAAMRLAEAGGVDVETLPLPAAAVPAVHHSGLAHIGLTHISWSALYRALPPIYL
ncbi:unnamed protein product [Peniophora sp. CBMAI 1063]|nr:unnamed protein product [Peniophora sp. CBMAI 1063]